jgi:purine-binding chemotaxis protein CheW
MGVNWAGVEIIVRAAGAQRPRIGEHRSRCIAGHVHSVQARRRIMAAVTNATQTGTEELLQLVSFNIGDEEFGVDILSVQEINRMMEVTRVPNAPEFVDGVINLRGKVIPVIDLRRRFGMERKGHDKNTRIIVVELAGKVVGFVVDAVREVLRIPRSVTEPPPALGGSLKEDYITAVGKLDDRLLILLDLEKVLTENEMASARSVA